MTEQELTPRPASAVMEKDEHPLIGKAFLSYAPGEEGRYVVEWQGEVLAVMASGTPEVGDLALVQLAEWLFGSASNCFLIPLADLATPPETGRRWFRLFHSAQERNSFYESRQA